MNIPKLELKTLIVILNAISPENKKYILDNLLQPVTECFECTLCNTKNSERTLCEICKKYVCHSRKCSRYINECAQCWAIVCEKCLCTDGHLTFCNQQCKDYYDYGD